MQRKSAGQGATEYLLTYGWIILTIGFVLSILFALDLLNGSSSSSVSCIGQPGFSCSDPKITADGALSFTFGQSTGYTVYNAQLACDSDSSSPIPSSHVYNVLLTGSMTGGQPNGIVGRGSEGGTGLISIASMASGTTVMIGNLQYSQGNLQCYPSNGVTSSMLGYSGAEFNGAVWMMFSDSPSVYLPTYVKVATITAKSS